MPTTYSITLGGVMIMNNLMKVLYIFLYIAPFAVIRYYPFRDRLRVSVKSLCLTYASIISIQATLFCFLSSQNFWNLNLTQAFRMVFVVFYAALSFSLVKEDFFKQFYIWFLMFTFASFVMTNANFIEARFFMNFAISYPHAVSNLVITLQVIILFPFAIRLIDKRIIPAIHIANSKVWKTVCLIPALFYSGTFLATWSLEYERVSSLSYLFIRYFSCCSILFVSIVLLEALKQTDDNARLCENARMTDQQLSLEREHYHMLTEHIEETKRTKHDLRHHLSLMQSYVAKGNIEKLNEYLTQYQLTLSNEKTISLCKNYTVDVITCYYFELSRKSKIEMDMQLMLSENIGVADMDLCVVFGNLLENAIEACKRQKDTSRFIKISAATSGNNVIITVDNTFEGDITKENDVFISSKRDGKGIGISSVEAVAKKYNGVTKFDFTGNIFSASVMLQAT